MVGGLVVGRHRLSWGGRWSRDSRPAPHSLEHRRGRRQECTDSEAGGRRVGRVEDAMATEPRRPARGSRPLGQNAPRCRPSCRRSRRRSVVQREVLDQHPGLRAQLIQRAIGLPRARDAPSEGSAPVVASRGGRRVVDLVEVSGCAAEDARRSGWRSISQIVLVSRTPDHHIALRLAARQAQSTARRALCPLVRSRRGDDEALGRRQGERVFRA